MKNSRRCSKCGGSDIVRIPDRRGRCASGNNIYTSNFENFGKIPVIRNRSIIPRTGKEKSLENGARKV